VLTRVVSENVGAELFGLPIVPVQQPCLNPDDPCLLGPVPKHPVERGVDLPGHPLGHMHHYQSRPGGIKPVHRCALLASRGRYMGLLCADRLELLLSTGEVGLDGAR
jgi:hypothetical protein